MEDEKIFEFINKIDSQYKIKFAYLFGSLARGEANNNSDIDIAIYFETEYSDLEDAYSRGAIIESGRAFFNKPVDIVSLNKVQLLLKYEIIKNSIILKDSDERGSFESLALREYFDYKYYSDVYNEIMVDNIRKGKYFGG